MGNRDKSDIEFEPNWPVRPDRPRPEQNRPRLDPPEPQAGANQGGQGRPVGGGSFGDTEIQPSKWTSHPTFHSGQPEARNSAGDTRETQVIPVVGPSRFDNGRPAPPQPSPQQARVAQPPQGRPQTQPQPQQPQPRPQAIRTQQPSGSMPSAAPNQAPPNRQPVPPQRGQQYDDFDYAPTTAYIPPDSYEGYDAYDPYEADGYTTPHTRQQTGQRRPVPPSQARGGRQPMSPVPGFALKQDEVKRKPRWRWIVWAFTGVLAIAAIIVVAVSLAWQGQYAGKIYPGVRVLDIDLSGKTQDEARKLLNDHVQAFVAQPLVLKWNDKEWRPSADEIGLKVDAGSTVNEAFQIGRNADFFGNVEQQWLSSQAGYKIPLNVQLSEPALQEYLTEAVASETDQELFEGDVRLNGTEVVALPGVEGRRLDVYGTIVAAREHLARLEAEAVIDLPVEVTQPAVNANEVEEVRKLLTVRVSSPITATAADKRFTLLPEAMVRFTVIERNPDRTAAQHVTLGWNDRELKILADRWAAEAKRSPLNAKFDWQNGAVSVVRESIEGLEVDPAAVVTAIKEHADKPDGREFPMPGKVITPTVSSKDIGALGIKEEIASGTSTFKGSSPERATNIRVAADLLNGTVVAPGGTFSFLETMGGIDEAHGFVPGYVIAAERTQLGVGGGVCQVSTTMFRAAFWSQLDITERNQHSYRVGWYEANGEPVGFDAAVFDPGVDLKFVNTTPGYILIKAGTTTDALVVTLYGTKLPGEVKLEGPAISNRVPAPPDVYEVDPRLPAGTRKQVETARGGLDTVITRRIIVPGQPDKLDEFHSHYQAWPNWYVVASESQVPQGARRPEVAPTAAP
ncbi:MAG: VanW family protein [Chloroflexota bacterium]|nr:VanW family protein [Chloroflexota bacterium]